jgi:hypothetical protein
MAEEIFCGKVERFFFPGPDWKQGDEKFEAIMLEFKEVKKIKYELFSNEQSFDFANIKRIHIIPSLNGENGELSLVVLLGFVGQEVCVSGEAIQSHTAHHVPPVILWGPKLLSADNKNKKYLHE